jgi:hypothetical protein
MASVFLPVNQHHQHALESDGFHLIPNLLPPVFYFSNDVLWRGADNPTLEKTLVTKSEEAIAGYFSWQKLLMKAKAHVGLSSQ